MLKTADSLCLQLEREKREAIEFIELLKSLSDIERARVRGYLDCMVTIKILNSNVELQSSKSNLKQL